MNIEKDFYFERNTRSYVFQYTAVVEGKTFSVAERVSQLAFMQGGAPLEYVWENMKRKIMRHFEQQLFKE
jgi:hypothetical protein